MNFRKFRKNAKALSPVVASIILIAVTVAVSVVVAAWMGGMTIGLMSNAEQGTITNLQFNSADNSITATVQNTGDVSITITTSAFVNGNSATITSTTIAKTNTAQINIPMPAGMYLTDGTQYQVKLITTKGNPIAYTSTDLGVTVPTPTPAP